MIKLLPKKVQVLEWRIVMALVDNETIISESKNTSWRIFHSAI